jgi:hypothetical protein
LDLASQSARTAGPDTPTQKPLHVVEIRYLFGSDKRKEHVKCNLHSVDEDQTVLCGNELEVHGMDNRPDLPRSLACEEEIVLDLISNYAHGVTICESQVREEDSHEDRTPNELVNSDLECDVLCLSSDNLAVKPVVKIVSRRSVVNQTKDGKSDETLHVEGTSTDKDLT